MKKDFSPSWKSSAQVRKQRKYRHNAPLHVRQKFASAHLAKDLRGKHGVRSVQIRKGDEAMVMRGNFKKKRAKVIEVNLLKEKVTLENINRQKKDGTKVPVFFHPSNLMIVSLGGDDKKRLKSHQKNSKEGKNASNKSSSS